MQAELKKQNFQSVVDQLSDQIKKIYSKIDEQILETRGQLKFGMFENVDNLPSFYILGETPAALGNLVEDIDAAIKKDKSLKNNYTKLKKTGGEKVFDSCVSTVCFHTNQLDHQENEKTNTKSASITKIH
uniref:Uncharacterized protein n=1 Tax=Ditylenchus dipsaci TaxID=166011 RepID=A0A915DK18_9BILA